MANGTIAFDTLQTSGQISSTAKSVDTDYIAHGTVKSLHVYHQGTPTIKSSFNVTSISDDATGLYTVTLTNSMSASEFAVTKGSASAIYQRNTAGGPANSNTIEMRIRDASANNADAQYNVGAAIGDLA